MITLLLGYIYGVGFGLAMVGGTLYFVVLNGLKIPPHPVKFVLGVIFWPVSLAVIIHKIYCLHQDGF